MQLCKKFFHIKKNLTESFDETLGATLQGQKFKKGYKIGPEHIVQLSSEIDSNSEHLKNRGAV